MERETSMVTVCSEGGEIVVRFHKNDVDQDTVLNFLQQLGHHPVNGFFSDGERIAVTKMTGMVSTRARGISVLRDPELNKGTAFTSKERDRLDLQGLLPPRVHSMEEQAARVMGNLRRKLTDLGKYVFLISLEDRNRTLFYRVLLDNIEELMPIIYTPTVGQACLEYSNILRRPRGLFITSEDKGRIAEVMRNWYQRDVKVIVVTDGERILGLGDIGADGMGIPVGKLALYTVGAGIEPSQTLPVAIDVGTENEALLNDPLYIGLRQRRLRGADYEELIDEFVMAVQEIYPGALIQFEDFANENAFRLLNRYREHVCCFNDDIQGTAAVTLAGLYSALRITGGSLKDQRLLFLGAGEAGLGAAELAVSALVDEGLALEEARTRCWLVDSKGLLVQSRTDLSGRKRLFAHAHEHAADFLSAVRLLKPTAIIGVSGRPKMFTQTVLREMAQINERPIIFALSNPTSKSECSAVEAYRWTEGRAVFASGSPFDPVEYGGKRFVPSQGNNVYIFPGIGLGVTASQSQRVTDEMFLTAARSLAEEVSQADLEEGRVYPPLSRIREVSTRIAGAIVKLAIERGLTEKPFPDDLPKYLESLMYQPEYLEYV